MIYPLLAFPIEGWDEYIPNTGTLDRMAHMAYRLGFDLPPQWLDLKNGSLMIKIHFHWKMDGNFQWAVVLENFHNFLAEVFGKKQGTVFLHPED